MSGGLLSGLEEAERCPYSGWKTVNNIDQSSCSPEDDDVCLLDDEDNNQGGNGTSSSDKRCLSDGHRSPTEFVAVVSSFKIPKKSVPLDIKSKEDNPWFNSSYCSVTRSGNRKWKTSNYSNSKGKSFHDIGYRIYRQGMPTTVHQRMSNTYSGDSYRSVGRESSSVCSGQSVRCSSQPISAKQTAYSLNSCTPKSRWKHTDAPGTLSSLRPLKLQEDPDLSYQETDSDIDGNNSDTGSPNRTETRRKPNEWSKLKQEQLENRSVLNWIMKRKRDNATVTSDSNCETESDKNEHVPGSSKGHVSNSDYDDCFSEICQKCLKKLSEKSRCQVCDNCIFPAQAATPRKRLSGERFHSAETNKLNTKRTYSNRRLTENHTPVLLSGSSAKAFDSGRLSDECQTHSKIRKKTKKGSPKRGKSRSSEDSDSDYKPQQKRHCKRHQQKAVRAKPVVITLSDEEEEAVEEATQPEDEKCPSSPLNNSSDPSASTVVEVPYSPHVQSYQDSTEAEVSPVKKKTKGEKLLKDKQKKNVKGKVEKVHGYERDNLEIEIMLGQRAYIGTLACTSTEPLKITCRDDTVRLNLEYGTSNLPITIAGKDIEYFKISSCSTPDVIVLGVTSGFALKLKARIHYKGKFFDPGSAVAAERDIVLEASECVQRETVADIMEWVKDKLSKEFFELSSEEKERILSNKESGSTTERHQQSSKQELGSAVTSQTKVYNTRGQSNKHPATVESKRLITYPPRPQQDGITVTTEDVACLAPGEFLNDVIIDFYLKYVFYEKLKAEDRERTYILSSFFYKRLTQRTYNNTEGQLSNAERMYANVRTWTKNVEIFDKDFVVVPINESSHWYLAVICFAGHDQPTPVNEVINDEEETESKQNTDADMETETEKNHDQDDSDHRDDENVPLAGIENKAAKEILSKKSAIKSRPCILVFDSLGNSRMRCMFNLRNYLTCEWSERRKDKEPREFTKTTIKGYLPKVPQQDNFCDCGVFVLQYMESFFEDAITDFTQPIRKPNWFSLDKIARKRDNIRKLIYQLKESIELDDP